jgi:hypothetical protein
MNEYEVRRGKTDNVKPENLRATMKDIFGNVEERDGRLVSSFGALKQLQAWAGEKNKTLCVETTMDPTVANDVAAQTIKAYNTFLERATGYNAKERGKRAQKKAKEAR